MNIFYLDRDPKAAAQMHCDARLASLRFAELRAT